MWGVVHHVPYDSSGSIGTALRRRRLAHVHLRPYEGDALPDVSALCGLVVLGGPSGSADGDEEHLVRERSLLAATAHAGKPVLGVCFGAQLLAVALGGSVRRAPEGEVGMGEISLTAEGAADPVFGRVGGRIAVQHWHSDEITAPPTAVGLATSSACDLQAFRWRTATYGLQFHAEINRDLASIARRQIDGIELHPGAVEAAAISGKRIVDAFLDQSASR